MAPLPQPLSQKVEVSTAYHVDQKKRSLKETLEGWNAKLEKQAATFVNMAGKVRATDRVLFSYYSILTSLEEALTDMQSKQAVLKEEFLNIQRHQDEMMELLNVGLDHPYHL